jgi:hypothetical protein
MRRRSRAGGKSTNAQAPKAAARQSRIAPKAARSCGSSAAREETALALSARQSLPGRTPSHNPYSRYNGYIRRSLEQGKLLIFLEVWCGSGGSRSARYCRQAA